MKKSVLIAFAISLGGFLFGFDAGIISGVMNYVNPEFNLTAIQSGWVVSSPSFSAMFAMLIAGRLSDEVGRKRLLIIVALLYAISAVLSAYAFSYEILYIARMIGGLAFGAALILAPIYITEIATADNRGRLVSVQQLNIVLGFFVAFLSNYGLNTANGNGFFTDENVWRWMLGVEFFPAILYFVLLFFVPKSPRWLFLKKNFGQARKVLVQLHGETIGVRELRSIQEGVSKKTSNQKPRFAHLFKKSFRLIIFIGLTIGILQQITGINAIYFYATSIFKQTGIGTDAAFQSGILLSLTTVLFTIVAMLLIDKMGRRPLLLIGIGGIAISLLICAFGFNRASYQLSNKDIHVLSYEKKEALLPLANKIFHNDVSFKQAVRQITGSQAYLKHEGEILERATNMNSKLVLFGILGFIACFAFSIGPVMWVMISELFPNAYRGLSIGFVGFVNSFVSWFVQQIFPWELENYGATLTFFLFGAIALVGFFILLQVLPETKGKTLEALEKELIKTRMG